MRFHKQTSKRNCGQIAVAAITGKDVETVEKIVGHSHGTKTRELVRALNKLGYKTNSASCRRRFNPARPPKLALVQVHKPGYSGWHWVAFGNGKFWDGHGEHPYPMKFYLSMFAEARVTSCIEVLHD